jgi:uncharacterized protein (DUF1501 family)
VGGELPTTRPTAQHGLSRLRPVTGLLDDLDERGLLSSTLVLAAGEFGRTPKINDRGGRDHWPGV